MCALVQNYWSVKTIGTGQGKGISTKIMFFVTKSIGDILAVGLVA